MTTERCTAEIGPNCGLCKCRLPLFHEGQHINYHGTSFGAANQYVANPTSQPASEPEEWRAEQRADGWWTLLTNSTILAFGLDTATKDTILADHAQAARTRELEEALNKTILSYATRIYVEPILDEDLGMDVYEVLIDMTTGDKGHPVFESMYRPLADLACQWLLASHRTAQEEAQ